MHRYLFHHLFYSTLAKKKIRHPLHGAKEINFHPRFMHTLTVNLLGTGSVFWSHSPSRPGVRWWA